MHKVVLVDDHPFIRASVRALVTQAGHKVVAEADNGVDAITAVREWTPDLVLLDITMPRMDGITVIERIRALEMTPKIIVLSYLSPEHYAMRCVTAGAAGFICKSDELSTLPQAIKSVMDGYVYFPQSSVPLNGKVGVFTHEEQLIATLSNRELSVFQQLSNGMSNKDIATNILLSSKTISCYKARLFAKLNVTSVVELADMARRNSII
ncbi:response regulator transcription factor [Pseudomonas yamanorum]|uniref:response regulator transcription factor n=1 Tax=Pseudomonas TaxID=286 RepID=UPI0015A3AC07|nr:MULTISPECIES: response regulator transcription factor [Pseudomonas]NWE43145.1 response regulator transcription factor [Pseudomonas yamanorum]